LVSRRSCSARAGRRAFIQLCTCEMTSPVLAGAANWMASGDSTNASVTTVYSAVALVHGSPVGLPATSGQLPDALLRARPEAA
jgi:hypothetical protein